MEEGKRINSFHQKRNLTPAPNLFLLFPPCPLWQLLGRTDGRAGGGGRQNNSGRMGTEEGQTKKNSKASFHSKKGGGGMETFQPRRPTNTLQENWRRKRLANSSSLLRSPFLHVPTKQALLMQVHPKHSRSQLCRFGDEDNTCLLSYKLPEGGAAPSPPQSGCGHGRRRGGCLLVRDRLASSASFVQEEEGCM